MTPTLLLGVVKVTPTFFGPFICCVYPPPPVHLPGLRVRCRLRLNWFNATLGPTMHVYTSTYLLGYTRVKYQKNCVISVKLHFSGCNCSGRIWYCNLNRNANSGVISVFEKGLGKIFAHITRDRNILMIYFLFCFFCSSINFWHGIT